MKIFNRHKECIIKYYNAIASEKDELSTNHKSSKSKILMVKQ
jgi:hypothetical protein